MGLLEWLQRRYRRSEQGATWEEQTTLDVEKRQREAYARRSIVEAVALQLDRQGERNHFGEVLDDTFRPRPRRA